MCITKEQILELVSLALRTIAQLSEKEVNSLLNKEATLVVKSVKGQGRKINKVDTKEFGHIEKHTQVISNFNTRGEAQAYLGSVKLKKEELIILSKLMSVHINKSDKKEEIINKIIESVVGSKLRVEAIKNTIL
ncbi:hypothetical protein SDC9_83255 [bioreactor metagenome]|uniref:Uncharacterized protein n=1 Tax=bioreactor metagenome TaxID=1076179 RepID=A0A644Z726_9ZZZZ